MVVQPTVSSCTLVMEAKTTGEPPCREPYSIVYVVLEELNVKICKTYFVPSRETFDQGNWLNSLRLGDGLAFFVVSRVTPVPFVFTFHNPLSGLVPPPPSELLLTMKS